MAKATKRIGSILDQMVLGGMDDDSAQMEMLNFQKNKRMSDWKSYKAAPWASAFNDYMTAAQERRLLRNAQEEKKRNRNSMMEYAKRRDEEERREAEEARAEKARKEARDESWKEREFQLKSADQRSRERHRATMEGIAQKKSIYDQDKAQNKAYEKMGDKITDPQERIRYLSDPKRYASQLRQKKAGGLKGLIQNTTGFGKDSNAYTLVQPRSQKGNKIKSAGNRAQLLNEARKIKRGFF
jgi:hypothetical protein